MPYADPPVAGSTLVRPAIKSPNYVAGVSGWSINRDGSAEFNNITARGNVVVQSGNNYIKIVVSGTPIIFFNPDTTLYFDGDIVANAVNATSADLGISAPGTGGTPGSINIRGSDTFANTFINLNGGYVKSIRFHHQGSASSTQVTANSAAVVPGGNLDVGTVGATSLVASQSFKVKGLWHGVGFVTPVAYPGNVLTMRLTRNGTQIASKRILGGNTALTQEGGCIEQEDTPGVGTHTYALSILHEAGSTAASVHTVSTANSPAVISVEGFGQ